MIADQVRGGRQKSPLPRLFSKKGGMAFMEKDSVLEMRHIYKTFPGVKALQNVDFTLKKGEIHALMGENGAGKSTLIKVLTGVEEFETGEIMIDDCLFFCINQDIYDSLTPEQQAVVDECGKLAVQYEREINRAGDDEILSRWQSKNGVEVVGNDELDIDSFKAIVEPVTEWYIGELQRQGYDDAEELVAAFK